MHKVWLIVMDISSLRRSSTPVIHHYHKARTYTGQEALSLPYCQDFAATHVANAFGMA